MSDVYSAEILTNLSNGRILGLKNPWTVSVPCSFTATIYYKNNILRFERLRNLTPCRGWIWNLQFAIFPFHKCNTLYINILKWHTERKIANCKLQIANSTVLSTWNCDAANHIYSLQNVRYHPEGIPRPSRRMARDKIFTYACSTGERVFTWYLRYSARTLNQNLL